MLDVSTGLRPTQGKLLAAFASVYLIWGSTYLAIRFAIETMPPHLMAAVRFLVAGAILYAWARWRGAPRPTLTNWRAATVVGGFLLLGGNGAVVWAETRVPSGLTALLVAMVPIWMLVLEMLPRLGGRKPRAAVVAGILLGLIGLFVLVAPGRLAGRVDPLGAAVLLLGCLCWAFGSLYSRGAALPKSGFLAAAMEMVAGGVLLLLFGLATGQAEEVALSAISARSLLSLAYLTVFGSLVGFTAYIWLLGATTPARVSTYAYVNPIVAVLLGWAFANEPMSLRTLIAAAVIIGAVALIIRYGARREVSAPAPAEAAPVPELLARTTAGGRA
ncbi:MAG TPA: drug/metabolite exporter YedA [Thermoanaerobaculia bacterium]|nr:drug/metabolite exporter YedA [Thermoanaerobaculia bacterium]